MDLRGNSRNLESGDQLTASNRPYRTGFGVCEWLLEVIRVDSVDNPIGDNHWLSPIVKSSKQVTERAHEQN